MARGSTRMRDAGRRRVANAAPALQPAAGLSDSVDNVIGTFTPKDVVTRFVRDRT